MITRLSALALGAALLAPLPALAQAPDFGDDTSQWANDGECDDPRFQGAGMTTTPVLEADARHDATDCRAAFEAGTIALAGAPATPAAPVKGGQAAPPAAPQPTPSTPQPPATPAAATGAITYGNDSSQWANDGECDDRRFAGDGVAASLSWTNAGRDATDCRALVEAGRARLWDLAAARAATQCAAIDFGTDGGEFANDGECDDIRFEGFGMASGVGSELVGLDAADCSQLCAFGMIGLRDY